MNRSLILILLSLAQAKAEVRTLTLAQALELAVAQNPDVALARLEERKSLDAVRVAKDPFIPRVIAGSGLAYSSGFPLSIEGSAPSIVETRAIATIFNQSQRLSLQKVKEDERTTKIGTEIRKDDVAYRTAVLYLEAGRVRQASQAARQQLENLERVEASVKARVQEGRELPIEARRAALRLAQAKQRVLRLDAAQADSETQLALLLGYPEADKVRPADPEARIGAPIPSEGEAVVTALQNSREIRRLESTLIAKGFEMKSYDAARLPKLDLVAQYGLFAKFNNYDKFFNRYQRHNYQLGVSVQVPIFQSAGSKAQRDITGSEIAGIRMQLHVTRDRTATQTRKSWQEIATLDAGVEVARLDLELARDQTSLLLALTEEGRTTQKQLEVSYSHRVILKDSCEPRVEHLPSV